MNEIKNIAPQYNDTKKIKIMLHNIKSTTRNIMVKESNKKKVKKSCYSCFAFKSILSSNYIIQKMIPLKEI